MTGDVVIFFVGETASVASFEVLCIHCLDAHKPKPYLPPPNVLSTRAARCHYHRNMTLASVLLRCRHVVRRCVHRQISIDDIDSDAIVDAFCFTIGAVLTLRFDTSNTAQIITMRPEQLQLTIKKKNRRRSKGICRWNRITRVDPPKPPPGKYIGRTTYGDVHRGR